MNPRNQSFVVTLLLIVAAVAMVVMALNKEGNSAQDALTINEVAQDIQAGKVARVVIKNNGSLRVIYNTGDETQTKTGVEAYKESDSTLVEQLSRLGVTTEQLSAESVKIEVG